MVLFIATFNGFHGFWSQNLVIFSSIILRDRYNKQVLFCNFSRKVQQIGTILRSCEKGTWTKQEIFWEKGTTKHALFYDFERKVQQKRYYFVAFRVRYSKTGKLLNKFSTFLSFLDIAIIREKGKTKQVLFFKPCFHVFCGFAVLMGFSWFLWLKPDFYGFLGSLRGQILKNVIETKCMQKRSIFCPFWSKMILFGTIITENSTFKYDLQKHNLKSWNSIEFTCLFNP